MAVHKGITVVLEFADEHAFELFKKEMESATDAVCQVWQAQAEPSNDMDLLGCIMVGVCTELGVEGYEWS